MNIEYSSPETVLQLLESAHTPSTDRTTAIFIALGCLFVMVATLVLAGIYLGG